MADGPFDRFLPEWAKLRQRDDIDDRRNEPWPWHEVSPQTPKHTMTVEAEAQNYVDSGALGVRIPPLTRMGIEAGGHDVANKISPEELMKFILDIENMNPSPPARKK